MRINVIPPTRNSAKSCSYASTAHTRWQTGKSLLFLLQKIFKKADLLFGFCFSADILQAELVFTDNHYGKKMEASYKKLWKLLIDRDMSKTDLRLKAGISTMALAKLGKNENVSMDVLKKVCFALECNIGDIMDLVPVKEEKIQ